MGIVTTGVRPSHQGRKGAGGMDPDQRSAQPAQNVNLNVTVTRRRRRYGFWFWLAVLLVVGTALEHWEYAVIIGAVFLGLLILAWQGGWRPSDLSNDAPRAHKVGRWHS